MKVQHLPPPHHMAQQPAIGSGPPHYRAFMITLRHTALGRTPLDKWSARRAETCTWQHTTFTTDRHPCPWRDSNTQSLPQTHALDRAATGIGNYQYLLGTKYPQCHVNYYLTKRYIIFVQQTLPIIRGTLDQEISSICKACVHRNNSEPYQFSAPLFSY
jgi:hypothetical protein